MKTALILTGKLVQDHEFIYPYYRLKGEGYNVTVALLRGEETVGSLGTKIPCDAGCRIMAYTGLSTLLDETDLLVIPGGAKCMEYLRQQQIVLDFIKQFDETGKTIASICHGAQMLISARVVSGRTISGYYSIKDDINNAGAVYVDAPYARDRNIISCPHYKYLGEWMNEVLKVVNENTAD